MIEDGRLVLVMHVAEHWTSLSLSSLMSLLWLCTGSTVKVFSLLRTITRPTGSDYIVQESFAALKTLPSIFRSKEASSDTPGASRQDSSAAN